MGVDKTEVLEVIKSTPAEKIKAYNGGLYKNYDVAIKGKYDLNGTDIQVPSEYLVIIVDKS